MDIKFNQIYGEYLRDESRQVGRAESIVFRKQRLK